MKKFIFLICFSIGSFVFAQTNIFHDRNFWKQNPGIDEIERLIKQGNDISSLNSNAFDAVTWALIEKVDNQAVKYLLSKEGNSINKLTHDGRTYIFWAAYKDNLEMMQYLLEQGARTDIVDSHGYSLFNFAATTGQQNTKLYDFLVQNGSNPTQEKNHQDANAVLLVAPHLDDFKLINYFKSLGLNENLKDKDGNGIFNYATKGGNISFLKKLIKNGYDYLQQNNLGGNAFMMASQGRRGHTNSLLVYKFLDSIGLDPKVTGKNKKTPLHAIAYRNSDLATFEFFLDHGVDINTQDLDGNTAFLNAARSNDLEVIKFLMPFVKDINHQNKNGLSALTMAFSRNRIEVVEFLLENKADISIIDDARNSLAFYLLKTYNNKEEFKSKLDILKAKGVSLTQLQNNGNTLLHEAVLTENFDLLKQVMTFNIDLNVKNKDGITALHLAAMKAKDPKVLMYLINNGADKTLKTDFQESAYDLAAENELLQQNNTNLEFLKYKSNE